MSILDIKVNINLAKAIGKVGTWIPLIYVIDGEAETATYGEYNDLDAIVAAGFTNATDAYKAAELIFKQKDAPKKIAILKGGETVTDELAKYANKDWRQLIVLSEFMSTVAEYIEGTENKMYFTHFKDTDALTAARETIAEFDRTVAIVYSDESVTYPEAAVVGATAGLNAGSFTYKNMILDGVTAIDIEKTALDAIHALNGFTIVEKAGDIVTSEGKVASGEYADIIDGKDYVIQSITYKTQKVYNNNPKVAYTNAGIALLEAAANEALKDSFNNGIIAENDDGSPAYSVSFALRSETTAADRASRKYPYGQFKFAQAGAIHDSVVTGEITD